MRIRTRQAPQFFLVMANVLHFPFATAARGATGQIDDGANGESSGAELVRRGLCERRYDLKGSWAGRSAMPAAELQLICEKEVATGIRVETKLPTLCDCDYLIEQAMGLGIRIKLEAKRKLMKQMLRDCAFLASENVMDYSLLVGRWRRTDTMTKSPFESEPGVS